MTDHRMQRKFLSMFSKKSVRTINDEFFGAAFNGDLPGVQLLSKDPAVNINCQSDDNFTPLYGACASGRVEVVKFLLGLPRSVNVNLPAKNGATPFFIACQNGRAPVISLLLADRRVDPTLPMNSGATPLYAACEYGHVEAVALLLADSRTEINQQEKMGATPLFIACEKGHVDVVSLLLASRGIDINLSKNSGVTPLLIASVVGHLPVTKQLLASGLRVDIWRIFTLRDQSMTAAGWVRELGRNRLPQANSIADLLESYERDPKTVTTRLRRELSEPLAGALFALVVFLSDGYLEIPSDPKTKARTKAQRFFSLACCLPMDLQMVLCNTAFGLGAPVIKLVHSEQGFRKFARD